MIKKMVDVMKVVVACDSFKGSLSSGEVGESAKRGVLASCPDAEVVVVEVADGGEGTVETIVRQMGGYIRYCDVEGPLGEAVSAKYGICRNLAVIEMAEASGLTLIPPEERDPLRTSSYGTGQLILDAINQGCRKVLIGIGGSATNDGGVGMLQALGFQFRDGSGKEIGKGGSEVGRISSIDDTGVRPEIREITFIVACDVDNPLIGERGASKVFGPQKGAGEEEIVKLEKGLCNFAEIARQYLGKDYSKDAGVGAAGGMGFAFRAFLGGELKRGIELILDVIDFEELLKGADLVITGEGCLDSQTLSGKVPLGVLEFAKREKVPVVAIGGKIEGEAVERLENCGFKALFPIVNGPVSLTEAMRPTVAKSNVERTVREIIRLMGI